MFGSRPHGIIHLELLNQLQVKHLMVLFLFKKLGGYMQDHEKVALQLIMMGVVIAMAKILASEEKATWRMVVGRSILNGFTTLGAGAILIWISDLSMLGVLGLGAFLGTLGSQFVEVQLRKVVKNNTGDNE